MGNATRVEYLLEEARAISKNTRYGTNEGISDRLALIFINAALKEIWSEVISAKTSNYTKSTTANSVAGTAAITYPSRLFLRHRIVGVQFSATGQEKDYFDLNGPTSLSDKEGSRAFPDSWGYLDGALYASPIPSTSVTNGFRIFYAEEMPILDIRRGVVNASNTVFNTSSLVFTTGPTMEPLSTPFDPTGADDRDYLCIVDQDGTFKVRNIRFTSIDATTGVVTESSSWTGASDDVQPATGNYFTSGYNATTHSPLDGGLDEFLKFRTAEKMYAYDKDKESEATWKIEADRVKDYISTLYNPTHKKGPINIRGFNDTDHPNDCI